MVSIKKLEKMIEPYESEGDWGGSDEFGNTYQGYRNGSRKARLDESAWWLVKNPQKVYKTEIIRVANELGLNIGN